MKGKRLIIITIMAAVIFAIHGCSAYRTLYNSIDIFIINGINRYFDISSEQRLFLKEKINEFKEWQRVEEMPGYIETLTIIRGKAAGTISMDDMARIENRLLAHGESFFRRVEPDTLYFISSLTDGQVNHFRNRMNQSLEEYMESLREDKEKSLEQEFRSRMKILSFVYGKISSEQERVISRMEKRLGDVSEARIQQFRANVQDFNRVLGKRRDRGALKSSLRGMIDDSAGNTRPHERVLDAHYRETKEIFIDIHNTVMTDEQRKNAAERIDWIIEIVRDLQK